MLSFCFTQTQSFCRVIYINALRPRENGCYFADGIFTFILLYWNCGIYKLKVVADASIVNAAAIGSNNGLTQNRWLAILWKNDGLVTLYIANPRLQQILINTQGLGKVYDISRLLRFMYVYSYNVSLYYMSYEIYVRLYCVLFWCEYVENNLWPGVMNCSCAQKCYFGVYFPSCEADSRPR